MATELVARLVDAIQSQDHALEEEQSLLEVLLKTGPGAGGVPTGSEVVEAGADAGGAELEMGEQEWTQLVSYVFERRYGWSEGADGSDERAMDSVDGRSKNKINETLDRLLSWLKEHPLSRPIFQAFVLVAPASQKPVVRQRCYLHLLDWVKRQSAIGFEALEDLLHKALVSALTDVWSATRKACAQRFKSMGQLFTLEQQQGIVHALLDAWEHSHVNDAWKAKEGILLGLTGVIAQFSPLDAAECPADANHAQSGVGRERGVKVRLRFGSEELEALPEFITLHLKDLLFGALAHQQLSVRENAAKAFSCYLSRAPLRETRVCLAEVIRKLQNRVDAPDGGGEEREVGSGRSCGRASAVELVEAFEAQGLLSLVSDVLERLPSRVILQEWDALIVTFSHYLSHSASTVRQACSSLFLKLMAKSDPGSPSLQRLVLQGLSTTWKAPSTGSEGFNEGVASQASTPDGDMPHSGMQGGCCGDITEEPWEGREGRLLAYELVLGFLVDDHTLKTFKSDPKVMSVAMPGASPCSPKCNSYKFSPIQQCDVHSGRDRSLGDRFDREAAARNGGDDGETVARRDLQQTNMSPFSASWMASPALSVSNAGTGVGDTGVFADRPFRTSPLQVNATLQTASTPGPSIPTEPEEMDPVHVSVLDQFRSTDAPAGAAESGVSVHEVGVTVDFQPLGVVLDRMFEEVLHSIGHDRWELRRMGLQVWPV